MKNVSNIKVNKNKTLPMRLIISVQLSQSCLTIIPFPVSLQNRDPKSSFEVPVRAGPLQARWSGPCAPSHTETETLQDGSWVQQYPCASAQVCFRPQNSPTGSAGGSVVWGSPVSLPFMKNGPQKQSCNAKTRSGGKNITLVLNLGFLLPTLFVCLLEKTLAKTRYKIFIQQLSV